MSIQASYQASYQEQNYKKEERPKLTVRQIAILRHIWQLNDSEKNLLGKYLILRAWAPELRELLVQDHSYKDELIIDNWRYEVCWIECGPDMLEELPSNRLFLLSVRQSKIYRVNLAVVRLIKEAQDIARYLPIPTLSSKAILP